MVLVLAGNDALRTVNLAKTGSPHDQAQYVISGERRVETAMRQR